MPRACTNHCNEFLQWSTYIQISSTKYVCFNVLTSSRAIIFPIQDSLLLRLILLAGRHWHINFGKAMDAYKEEVWGLCCTEEVRYDRKFRLRAEIVIGQFRMLKFRCENGLRNWTQTNWFSQKKLTRAGLDVSNSLGRGSVIDFEPYLHWCQNRLPYWMFGLSWVDYSHGVQYETKEKHFELGLSRWRGSCFITAYCLRNAICLLTQNRRRGPGVPGHVS